VTLRKILHSNEYVWFTRIRYKLHSKTDSNNDRIHESLAIMFSLQKNEFNIDAAIRDYTRG